MPNIPTFVSRETTLDDVGALDRSFSRVVASPDSYGAAMGKAIAGLGGTIGESTDALYKADLVMKDRKRAENIANGVAQTDMTTPALQARLEAPLDGSGVAKKTVQTQRELIDQKAQELYPDDPKAATQYRTHMLSQIPRYASQAVQYEFERSAEHSKEEANKSLNALGNKLRADPTTYDMAVEQGNMVLDASTSLSATDKQAYKLAWAQNAANTKFEGQIMAAKTVDDLQRVENELIGKGDAPLDINGKATGANEWQKKLSAKDYESLLTHVASGKKVFQTKADTEATAAVTALEARSADGVMLPTEEIQAAQKMVHESKNTLTMTRFGRVVRDQELLTRSKGMSPSQMQANANEARGGAGNMYPNLPTEVSRSISEATAAFPNVSAAYLGGTATREYGGNFPKRGMRGDAKFKPQAARDDVNLSNVRTDVVEAATVAGQLYGEPLVITSGYRSQAKQDSIRLGGGDPNRPGVAKDSHHTHADALDISTVGKTPEQKAKLVDSLVQSGFTGFGEYGTHIHVDMRQNVPNGYGPGKGGWTDLSPEVQAVLNKRGFKPGASSAEIDRSGPGAMILSQSQPSAVDYGVTNKGSNGKGTATGLMQFDNRTWDSMADPTKNATAVAAVRSITGVDFAKMTPDERREYRKDPRVSTIMGAALASQNKNALESTLQRSVSDAEVYMAHFLGAGGASALLRTYASNADTSAVALLPDAAAANEKVFYNKDGSAKTVRQLYDGITTEFLASPNQVKYGDSEFWQKRTETARKQIKENPVGYATREGLQTVVPLTAPNGWETRGATYNNIGKRLEIPTEDNKPFDATTELPALQKQFKDGSAEEIVSLLQNMAKMDNTGRGSFSAGMTQLGMKNSAYDVAGQVAQGDVSTANEIIRGSKRMEADTSTKALLGQEHDASDQFNKTVGQALYGVSPESRDAIRKAANAHYVETAATQGVDNFDKSLYAKSIQAVMGGRETPRVASVNGSTTVLPKGVDEASMEKAVDNLSTEDLVAQSVGRDGRPAGVGPYYTDGKPVSPLDISSQGKFRYVRDDVYQVQMGDGKYLVTPQREQGGFTPYLMKLDKQAVDKLATRARSTNSASLPVFGQ